MSDTASSGTPAAAPFEPAAVPASPAAPEAAGQSAPTGTFGTTRGSGLARGKRPATASASSAPVGTPAYRPTSIEVVTPQREYKNPFASELPVEPAPNASSPSENVTAGEVATNVDSPVPQTPVPAATPAPTAVAPTAAPEPASPETTSISKPSLNILPPAEPKRVAHSWEQNSGTTSEAQAPEVKPRREERPTFRPERREGREPRAESREPRREFRPEQREPRIESRGERREPRFEPRPVAPPEPPKKSGGFIGWLKDLFGGKSDQPAATPTETTRESREGAEGDFRGRRRNRGGRGRGGFQGGENRGPREGQSREGGAGYSGGSGSNEGQGGQGDGFRRRRRRGGRGRNRGPGGGNDPRPEGTQGGGGF